MAKPAAKSKIEIVEVKTPKVDHRIKLEEVMDQLANKAQGSVPRGALATPAGGARQDRITRIQALSAQLAQELRALKRSPAAGAKASARKRGK